MACEMTTLNGSYTAKNSAGHKSSVRKFKKVKIVFIPLPAFSGWKKQRSNKKISRKKRRKAKVVNETSRIETTILPNMTPACAEVTINPEKAKPQSGRGIYIEDEKFVSKSIIYVDDVKETESKQDIYQEEKPCIRKEEPNVYDTILSLLKDFEREMEESVRVFEARRAEKNAAHAKEMRKNRINHPDLHVWEEIFPLTLGAVY